jgi:hypothetical protein
MTERDREDERKVGSVACLMSNMIPDIVYFTIFNADLITSLLQCVANPMCSTLRDSMGPTWREAEAFLMTWGNTFLMEAKSGYMAKYPWRSSVVTSTVSLRCGSGRVWIRASKVS